LEFPKRLDGPKRTGIAFMAMTRNFSKMLATHQVLIVLLVVEFNLAQQNTLTTASCSQCKQGGS
jgi:hypothetical protein